MYGLTQIKANPAFYRSIDFCYTHSMNKSTHYKGAIWTDHALQRQGSRGLSLELASKTFNTPDHSKIGKNPGTWEYTKKFGVSTVTVIAKKNEKNEWIVISNWIDPPLPGTEDEKKQKAYRGYQKKGFWGKLFSSILKQLGM